ncbi:MAG TPA: TraR/DksA C4-type zinc finger protein [Gaiellales bacterium]|jgi:DnaK suppressor protein|nr:TraR/DksA C4-type zinc finger protein [Gaiellales bacterium]
MAVVDIEAVRRRLELERTRVVEERQHLIDDTSRSMEDAVDEDGNDSHMADSASETLDREMELSLGDNAGHLLASINAALARLDSGTYGNCERCGQPIAVDRLEALPWASKCIDCKRLEERG